MTDITEQLLTFEPDNVSGEKLLKMLSDAADEIERLRDCEAYNARSVLWANGEIERLRVEKEKLGKDVNYWRYGNPDFAWSLHQAKMVDLMQEIERLRAALKYYADKSRYAESERVACCGCCTYWSDASVLEDAGLIARVALGEKK